MGGGVKLQWCTGKCANREWNCYKEFGRHNRLFYNIHNSHFTT